MEFALLFVCTGNTCRSPIAERLALAGLAAAGATGLQVGSAGTRALPGRPMEVRAAKAIRRAGGLPDGFRTRRLDADLVRRAGLILTAAREHRAAVVELEPAAVRRTFTMLEFAALAAELPEHAELAPPSGTPAERAGVLAAEAARLRGRIPPLADYDIADPIGGRRKAYTQAVHTIAGALAIPLARIGRDPRSPAQAR
jgi:protein-tyrosine phosphatase